MRPKYLVFISTKTMRITLTRIANILIIVSLTILIPRTTDFNNLTMSDYIFLSLYIFIIILFIVNTVLEIINKRTSDNV